jgi:hypothetical protein
MRVHLGLSMSVEQFLLLVFIAVVVVAVSVLWLNRLRSRL